MAGAGAPVCSKQDILFFIAWFPKVTYRGLSSGRIRILVCGRRFTAEGQLEFVGNLGEDVETHVLEDAGADAFRRGRETALAVRVIGIVE